MTPYIASTILRINTFNHEDTRKGIRAMAKIVAYAIIGKGGILTHVKAWCLSKRFMKLASFEELFEAYSSVLKMIPIEDIAVISSAFKQLSQTVSKGNE